MRTLTGSSVVPAPPDLAYRALVEPAEQMKWNTLYLEASQEPAGPIKDGSIMRGVLKGTGQATVHFDDVAPGQHFTHRSAMQIRGISLGDFTHRYEVLVASGVTTVRQTIRYEPTGLGRPLARIIMRSFAKRLPESFTELNHYLTSIGDSSPQAGKD